MYSRRLLTFLALAFSVVPAAADPLPAGNRWIVLITSAESNRLDSYAFDESKAELSLRAEIPTGKRPSGIASADGRVFVANNDGKSVSRFALNPRTGTLEAKGATPVEGEPMGMCLRDDVLFAVCNDTSRLQAFKIEKETGDLRPAGSTQGAGHPQSVVAHPGGKFLFASACTRDEVQTFAWDPETGKLSLSSQAPAGKRPNALAVDPKGNYLFVANMDSDDIWAYRIDEASGKLSPSFQIGAGTTPEDISMGTESILDVIASGSEELLSFRMRTELRSNNIPALSLNPVKPATSLKFPRAMTESTTGRLILVLQRGQALGADFDELTVLRRDLKTQRPVVLKSFPLKGDGEKCLAVVPAE